MRTVNESRLRAASVVADARSVTREFIPGLELARLFYAETVRPLLDQHFPGLPHTAALIGAGSEVLGYDTARSTDHNWGPRLQVFLSSAAETQLRDSVHEVLTELLPAEFRGHPTVFAASGAEDQPPSHWITVAGLRHWLTETLGFDPTEPIGLLDWLATPTQVLAEITGGAVFHDGLADESGGLEAARANLTWYPHDVWLYVLACQWQRIDQEEPFPGRCAEVGDDLGSAVVTARLVRDLMRLGLLMQRRYPPYSKWLGTALARSPAAPSFVPPLRATAVAASWPERERNLCEGYEAAARLHNALALTPHLNPSVRPRFYDRPFRVLGAARFADAVRDQIQDDRVRELPTVGAVDQFIDSTDALTGDPAQLRAAVAARLGI